MEGRKENEQRIFVFLASADGVSGVLVTVFLVGLLTTLVARLGFDALGNLFSLILGGNHIFGFGAEAVFLGGLGVLVSARSAARWPVQAYMRRMHASWALGDAELHRADLVAGCRFLSQNIRTCTLISHRADAESHVELFLEMSRRDQQKCQKVTFMRSCTSANVVSANPFYISELTCSAYWH